MRTPLLLPAVLLALLLTALPGCDRPADAEPPTAPADTLGTRPWHDGPDFDVDL